MESYVDQLVKILHLESLDSNPSFSFIEKTAKVKPSAIVIALLVFVIIVTLISNATSIVIAVGCCCVPAYFTFTVIDNGQWDEIKRCLIYWITYAILEVFSPLLSFIFPSTLYLVIRLGLAVAFIYPQSPLAIMLYQSIIQPFLEKHQQEIDEDIGRVIKKGKQIFQKGQSSKILSD